MPTKVASIPFLDLSRSHAAIRDAVLADIADLVDSNGFTNGPPVAMFEREFAAFCGVKECVGVGSGLDALRLALVAAGIEPGDRVAVPALTFAATFEAVTQAGGVPLVVDVLEDDFGMDANALRAALSDQVRFVMPVHLYGQMVDIRAINAAAATHRSLVISDACQAHGARRDGVDAAGQVLAAAFSFYPGKNLGAFGDAGAVTTDDHYLADRVRALREHGQTAKYHHEYEGWTSRLDTVQAIALRRKLVYLDEWNGQRDRSAAAYLELLAGVGDLKLPSVASDSRHVWHLFVVRTASPDSLAAFLRAHGVATGRHYPQPPHLSPAYEKLGLRRGDFPVAEVVAEQCLSLPMFPGITTDEIEAVAGAVRSYFDG